MKRKLILVLVAGILLSTCTATLAIVTSNAIFYGSSASAMVIAINSEWGNIDTEFVYSDLEKLGISKGVIFTVQFEEKSFKVMMANIYDDVQKGEWVAFITAEGFLRIARNLDSAVKLLGCKPGDNIIIKK
jgi:S-adenosylmethionine hydrolase